MREPQSDRDEAKSQVIGRAQNPLNYESFLDVFKLIKERAWLDHRNESLVSLWNFCTDANEWELVRDLILLFDYINGNSLDTAYSNIMRHVLSTWAMKPGETLFIAIADDASPDGSQAVIQGLKSKIPPATSWGERHFLTRIQDLSDKKNLNEKTFILVEDFLGTGDKLVEQLGKVKDLLGQLGVAAPKIRLVVVAAMERSREVLESSGITYYCDRWLRRGISDHRSAVEAAEAIKLMKGLERRLQRMVNGQILPHLGYGKSESLVYLENISIPNNVFPIFWWPNDANRKYRNPMFTRAR